MLAPSDTQSLLTQAAAEFAEADRLETLAAANLVEATFHRLAGARLLSQIKRSGEIPHGQWLPWLKSRFTLNPGPCRNTWNWPSIIRRQKRNGLRIWVSRACLP